MASLKKIWLPILGIGFAAVLFFQALHAPFRVPELPSGDMHQESYTRGFTDGYNSAKEENDAAYQRGYEAAREEIGSGAFTRYGFLGLTLGFVVSGGALIAIKKKEFSLALHTLKQQRMLKKAFRAIPPDLPDDIEQLARQIAQTYVKVLYQLRSGNSYLLTSYAKKWQGKLQELMDKAVHLMERIHDLEISRAHVDAKELSATIRRLRRTIQNPDSNDEHRNAAAKSLQRAKQTRQDLMLAQKNIDLCKTSLQGLNTMLHSMHLKISNLNVHAQHSEQLEELSSDLENELTAIEESIQEFSAAQ